MSAHEILLMDATKLAARIRARDLSPVEVVDAFLEQIDRLNPILNACCFVLDDQARAEAKTAEAAVTSGRELGPLHGVPIAFKDVTFTKGVETTFGSWVFKGNVPESDAVVVERARKAGAIVVGKTQTPEFGHSAFTSNPVFGTTRNPWNLERTPGGSSGGSAAAVAASMVPIAEGNDGGGSVRIPASCCGIYGLKPHFGRIPLGTYENAFDTLLCYGPLAWTVRDAALLLSIWAGPDSRDPLSLPDTGDDFLAALEGDVAGARVACSPDLGQAVDPDIDQVFRRAVGSLEAIGCRVEEVEVELGEEALSAFATLFAGGFFGPLFGRYVPEHGHHMTRGVLSLIRRGEAISAVEYIHAQITRTTYYERIRKVLDEYDFLVTPTLCVSPPSVHNVTFGPEEVSGRYVEPSLGWLLTWPFNMTTHPAASIPAGFTPDGLPAGMQIVSRRFSEAALLRLSARFEEAAPWRERRPAIALADQAAEARV